MKHSILPPHGGYKKLLSYQKSVIVYDATVHFCQRFVSKRDRTYDQMVQAARSGKQNIVEGSMASGTSKEMELKLTNVARASLEELLEDYRDFLRQRNAEEWGPQHPFARRLSQLNRDANGNYEKLKSAVEHPDPVISANAIIGMIRITTLFLDRQIKALQVDFLRHGGIRERMTQMRKQTRG